MHILYAFSLNDIKAKVGKEREDEIVGKFRRGTRNELCKRWVQWCTVNDQIITNTPLQEHWRRLWTSRSQYETRRIRLITIIYKTFRKAILHCEIYPSTDWGNDRFPVVCYPRVKLQKLKKVKATSTLYDRLTNNPS